MTYHTDPAGCLHITCSPEEQKELQELRKEKAEDGWGSCGCEAEVLEGLVCNSELQWIPEGSTEDLTSAPMIGILSEPLTIGGKKKFPRCFGFIECGRDRGEVIAQAITARWAFMAYQVRTFLDDLADYGECVWQGGAA